MAVSRRIERNIMEKRIEFEMECQSCSGTGLYSGMAEGEGLAVVCRTCNGTGKVLFKKSYNVFKGRKIKEGVKRVYLPSRFKLGLGVVNFSGAGEIDMDKKGVSYEEFLNGSMPEHIKELECPMRADQSACHRVDGFIDWCQGHGLGYGGLITNCKNQCNKLECWDRFYSKK
jgi:hypothetical protein